METPCEYSEACPLAIQLQARISALELENQALRREVAQQAGLLNGVGQALIGSDLQGRCVYFNAAAEQLYDRRAAEMLGEELIPLVSPFNGSDWERETHAHILQGKPWSGEIIQKRRDGTTFPAYAISSPHYDSAGNLVGVIGAITDLVAIRQAEHDLRTSEQRYRIVSELSASYVFEALVDANGQIVEEWCTEAFEKITGYSTAWLIAQGSMLPIVYPDDRARYLAFYEQLRAGGSQGCEYRIVRADASIRWLSVRIRVGFPPHPPGYSLWTGTGQDVTEQKEVEELLRLKAALLQAVGQAVIATDTSGKIIYWNGVAETVYGWDALETLHKPIAALGMTFDDGQFAPRTEGHQRWVGETMHARRDGTRFPVIGTAGPYLDSDGRIAGYLGVFSDSTRRKEAEEALRQLNSELELRVAKRTQDLVAANWHLEVLNRELARSRDLLTMIVNHLDAGLALLDPEGVILMANNALGRLLCVPTESLLGKLWKSFALAAFDPYAPEMVRLAYSDSEGQNYVLDLQAALFVNVNPAFNTLLIRVIDMTERLQIEVAALQSERLLATGRLAAVVAHEVNTPLQAMQNLLYLSQTAPRNTRDRYLVLVQDEIRRVSAIMRHLLELNQVGSREWGRVDCHVVIERVLLLTDPLFINQRVGVVREWSADLPPIWASADGLNQVLLNLVMNALDAMPNGGELTIRTRRYVRGLNAHVLVIELTDTGQGIPPEQLAAIFEAFFTTKPHGQGTGLGLAISRHIIDEHGGNLEAESHGAGGTTFRISLPLNAYDTNPVAPSTGTQPG